MDTDSRIEHAQAMEASVTVNDARIVHLRQFREENGLLTIAQCRDQVPFKVDRCFVVQAFEAGTVRGHHAHRALQQFLICVSGEIEVQLDDGEARRSVILRDPSQGLLVPAGIWSTQVYNTPTAILLVLCDQPFSEADYIRDYDVFVRFADERRRAGRAASPTSQTTRETFR
jgi:dTDP-4-dehydrorhamnose 3,5-epimerase-like enzyme